jgi:hypothetical protein
MGITGAVELKRLFETAELATVIIGLATTVIVLTFE